MQVGVYCRVVRKIPVKNMIQVHISNAPHNLARVAFAKLKQEIDAQLTAVLQALLMV